MLWIRTLITGVFTDLHNEMSRLLASYAYKNSESVLIRPEKLQLSNITQLHCCKDILLYTKCVKSRMTGPRCILYLNCLIR